MADYVELTSDGLREYKWNGDDRRYDSRPVDDERVISRLRCACKIKEGTTLGDIFRLVDSLPTLKEFVREYAWCWPIDELHAQGYEPMRSEDSHPLEYLEVGMHSESWDLKGDKSFSVSTDFCGVGAATEDCQGGNMPNGKQSYSVSMTPMYDVVDLPVKIDKEIKIHSAMGDGGMRPILLFQGEYCLSLLEVLDAIYDDISFYGGPAEAQETLEEIRELHRQVESGEAKTIPLEDVLKQLDDEID